MVLKTGDVHSTLVAKRFLGRSSEVVGALLQVRLGALQASCSSFLFFPPDCWLCSVWVGWFFSWYNVNC